MKPGVDPGLVHHNGVNLVAIRLADDEVARALPPSEVIELGFETKRIFDKAQESQPWLPAPSAWAATATMFGTAGSAGRGMGSTQPSPSDTRACSPSLLGTRHCAETSTPGNDASAPVTTSDTCARVVPLQPMELKSALERRKQQTRTPYRADGWERALRDAGLEGEYGDVVLGLRHGFRVGFPQVGRTQAPRNSESVLANQGHFTKILFNELGKGRWIGPVSRRVMESVMGPFQSSPLSIIPKPTPGKFRVIQNFSFPNRPSSQYPLPSVNSHIDASNFPCTCGTFRATCLLISALPEGSQMAVRDVAEAYRTIPLHCSQWSAAVVQAGEDEFLVDVCVAFGSASSGGVYGLVADAACAIMRARGIGPVTKWVDDHPFFRVLRERLEEFNETRHRWQRMVEEGGRHQSRSRVWYGGGILPDGDVFEMFEDCTFALQDLSTACSCTGDDGRFAYCMADVDRVSEELGIPWEHSKDVPFSSKAPYLGFVWDLKQRTVSLSSEKAAKYRLAIEEWRRRPKHPLEDVQQLYGKLLHASLVIPAGRAQLVGLERALGNAYNSPFMLRHPPRSVGPDLDWWIARLQQPNLTRSVIIPEQLVDLQPFSDASTGTGIAIVIGGRWRAWRLLPGWRTRAGRKEIGWAEAVGFYFLVVAVTKLVSPGTHIRLYGDNEGVVRGWRNSRSRKSAVNGIFKLALDFLESVGFIGCIHCEYVPSGANPADAPSRGVYPSYDLLLPPIDIPAVLIPFVIDALSPLTSSKLGTADIECVETCGEDDSDGGEDAGVGDNGPDEFSALVSAI